MLHVIAFVTLESFSLQVSGDGFPSLIVFIVSVILGKNWMTRSKLETCNNLDWREHKSPSSFLWLSVSTETHGSSQETQVGEVNYSSL